jgi:CheY-like chemotaxis protein
MELAFARVAPGPLVEEAIAGLRAYAAGRDVSIGCEIEADLPDIEADRDRLIQVLTNLISNGVKFSPVGGRMRVRATRAAGGITIAIRDWGIGIGAADQPRLFQRFQRLRRGGSEEPGTGLGLAISKAIVDRHRGTITVQSAETEGSTFMVFMPLSVRADRPVDSVAAAAELEPEGRPTVLLVDDDADLGTVLDVSLGTTYRLLRVERGVEALDVARVERPHVILLDVVLPDLSGYDVLRILRHSEATRGIPVVMMTVRPERELARRLGAAGVVAKPIDIDDLTRTVARTLRTPPPTGRLRVALGPMRSRTAETLAAAFEAGGHAVFTAEDAWGLVRCADQNETNVVVVESLNGDTTVAFLRGHAVTRRLPLVLVTDGAGEPIGAGCTSVAAGTADADLVRATERAVRQPSG